MAQMAQTEAEEDVANMTFSDKIDPNDLPSVLRTIYNTHSTTPDRDKMLIGAMTVLQGGVGYASGYDEKEGVSGVYGIYDGHRVYASSYVIIWGDAGSSKGEVKCCANLLSGLRREMREEYEAEYRQYEQQKAEWDARHTGRHKKDIMDPAPREPEYRDLRISGNTTSTEFKRMLRANGGGGVIVETEADGISTIMNSDYSYSDDLRKIYHHEPVSANRTTEKLHVNIEEPRLSILITCTGGQIPKLLPTMEDGLGSRFHYYRLFGGELNFRNVFVWHGRPLEDIYREQGERLMPLFHALQMRRGNPLQFVLSARQQQLFLKEYNAMLHEQFRVLGSGINAFVLRMALSCFRYCMLLTLLRRLDEWGQDTTRGIFDPDERALTCDDRDFHTAMVVMGCLINHSAYVFGKLNKEDDNPFADKGINLKHDDLRLYQALPDGPFRTQELLSIADQMGYSKRTANRVLRDFVHTHHILVPLRGHGRYKKCEQNDN